MSKAIRIDHNGGPEVLKVVDVEVGDPGPGEIRIRHKAVGLNYIDIYQRSGLYTLPMPLQMGMEASGVVEAVGEGVSHLKAGDRAAYASQPPGSYCELRVMPAKTVCRLPDAISFETGAAMMLKGLTAQYLLKRTQPQGGLNAGDFVLFHAAAGGVGLIATQWAKALGLRLIGTAGSDAKCAGERDHRRAGRQGGLRLGGQRHLGPLARMPGAVWFDGQFWQFVRPGAGFLGNYSERQGPVCHAPNPVQPYRHPRVGAADGR